MQALLLCAALLSVNLDWFRNPEPDVTNYRIYYGTNSGAYTQCANAGNNTNITITGLAPNTTYFFVATALNAAGQESKPSAQISYTTPPGQSMIVLIEGAANPAGPWTSTTNYPWPIYATTNWQYYRAKMKWE